MKLSVSCRIAEGFLSKEEAILSLPELCDLAIKAGYEGICMRASQVGVHSSAEEVARAAEIIREHRLDVTMVTGDFDIVYNNDNGPNCLGNITRYLDLAEQFQAPLIRVCVKTPEDLTTARKAAEEAAERNITLVHQCHTLSLFETVDQIENSLRQIDHPHFGLIYEAANLEGCRQDYGEATVQRLAPWTRNVYLQNQRLNPQGEITLDTWCHGPVSFDNINIPEPGGIDFPKVFQSLRKAGYDGVVTVHQSAPQDGSDPVPAASETATFLKKLIAG